MLAFLLLFWDLYASFSMIAVAQSGCYLGNLVERGKCYLIADPLFLIIRDLNSNPRDYSCANKLKRDA